MLVLKADPWLPDYGMGFDVDVDDAPSEPWRALRERSSPNNAPAGTIFDRFRD